MGGPLLIGDSDSWDQVAAGDDIGRYQRTWDSAAGTQRCREPIGRRRSG